MKNLTTAFTFFLYTFFLISIAPTQSVAQTDYTWDGSTDTDFATADNWTPSGVPGSGDNITIVTGSNTCQLDGNRTVNKVTVTSGTLDLETYTLTVSDRSTLNGGTMEDGKLLMTTGTAVFNGTTMDCKVDVTANITKVYDTHFKDTVLLDEVSTGNGYYTHGNIFEKYTEITNNSTGYIYVANTAPDTFRVNAVFNLEAAGFFIIGQGATTVHFEDDVVLNNHSGNTGRGFSIGGNASSAVDFLGDIEMNVTTGSGYIAFNLGTITHHGQLTVGSEGYHSGTLTLKGYRQNAATAVDLSPLEDDARITLGPDLELEGDLTCPALYTKLESGCEFNGDVTIADLRTWNGAIFHGVTDLTVTTGNVYTGGNMFNDTASITNNGTGYLNNGDIVADTFNLPVTFNLEAAGYITLGNSGVSNYYADKVTLNNHSGNSTRRISIGGNASVSNVFDGEIELNVEASSGDIRFWLGTTHNGLLTIGSEGYNNGTLTLRNYEQTASGTIDLSGIGGSADLDVLTGADITADFIYGGGGTATLTDAVFQGDVTIESSSLPVTDCTFHGTTYLEKTGGVNNLNDGNAFHGPVTIENSSTSNYLYWGNAVADTFKMDLTLINRSSQPLWINYSSEGELGGDLTLDGDSASVIRIGSSTAGRKVVFNGSTDQYISILETDLEVMAYRMEVDKSGGKLKVNNDITATHELTLTDGVVQCLNDAVITLSDGVEPTATDSSYVEGPVKKIGNDAYTFPIGRNGVYRPIGISAPSSTTDAFTAEYFESNSDWINSHSSKDASLDHLSTNEYWTLTRDAGTSTPTVTLSWDTITSCTMDTSLVARNIAGWDGSNWDDLGNGGTTGNVNKGTISTASTVTDFEMFILESDSAMQCECELPPFVIGPSDTCIGVPMNDNEMWITLVPDSSSIDLDIWLSTDNDLGVIDSILLYEACDEVPIYTKGIDTVYELWAFALEVDSLVADEHYKLRLLRKDTVLNDNYYNICLSKRAGGDPCVESDNCDLVLNGDFEATTGTQLCTNVGVSPICGWTSGGGTPDVHSSLCDGFQPAAPPITGWYGTSPTNDPAGAGIVDPTGNKFFSIVTYRAQGAIANSTPDYREYITTQLLEPMEADVCYYYSYNLANRANNRREARYSTPGVGISFSQGPLPNQPYGLINALSGLTLIPLGTVGPNWTLIDGVVTPATGGQDRLTIGNFWTDAAILGGSTTPSLASNYPWWLNPVIARYARYLVNDVSVIKMALQQEDEVEVCVGGELILSVCAPDDFSYTWQYSEDPNFGATVGNVAQVIIDSYIPSEHAGTYTVTITAPNGTHCDDDVLVTTATPDDNIVISGCEYTCENTMPCTLSVEIPGGYSNVTWNVPSDGTNPIVWTDNGTSIIVTDWGDYYGQDVIIGVSAFDGEKDVCNFIEMEGCCIVGSGGNEWGRIVNLQVSDVNTTNGTPGITGPNPWVITDDFTVTGTFTIDQDLELRGCEVRLYEGARIVVEPGVDLTITDNGGGDNSWLHACDDYLWKALKVESTGTLTINNNTLIEDAEFATLFYGNGMLDVTDSEYNKNVYGVYVEDKTNMATAIISNNDFTCTGALNTNALNRVHGIAGIYAKSSAVSSGTSTLTGNHFEDLYWGIRGENSDVEVWNENSFEDIRKWDDDGGFWSDAGYGVQCYSNGNTSDHLTVSKNNDFSNSDHGIRAWGMTDVEISGINSFTNLDGGQNANGNSQVLDGFGVRIHGNRNIMNVTSASFTDVEIGVMLHDNGYTDPDHDPNNILVSANTITQAALDIDAFTVGIWATGFGITDAIPIDIHNNTITNTQFGIFTWNLQNPWVYENDITVPIGEFSSSRAIVSMNCDNPEIVNNVIESGLASDHVGIMAQDCPYADERCNDITYADEAIFNLGPMMGAIVEKNEMDNCVSGYVHKNGYINVQGTDEDPTDNLWVNHDNFTNHTWRIGNGPNNNWLNYFYVRVLPSAQPNGNDYTPIPFVSTATAGTPFEILSEQADDDAVNDLVCSGLPLFRLPDDTLAKAIALDTLVFYGSDSIEARELTRLHLFQTLKHDTLYTIDSTLQAFVDTMQLTAYGDLDSVINRLGYPLDSTDQAQLLGLTSKASPVDTLQSLLKEVLTIGVDHYYSGDSSWTDQHILDLRQYAALCPFTYGPGVYHARTLLMNMDTTMVIYENSCETPTVPSMRFAAPGEGENDETLRLYPNPTTGSVTIDCHLNEDDIAELRVFDMAGRQVYTNNEVCGTNSIVLENLSEGLYHCVLVINGKASLSEKLVILRE